MSATLDVAGETRPKENDGDESAVVLYMDTITSLRTTCFLGHLRQNITGSELRFSTVVKYFSICRPIRSLEESRERVGPEATGTGIGQSRERSPLF